MALEKGYAGSGDVFMKMLVGAALGAAFGFLLGGAVFFQWEGTKVFMEIPGAMLGSIIGITLARVFAGGKKQAPAPDPKAKKSKPENKPESKPESKPEKKPENKPEKKSENKPEKKPEKK